MHGMDDDTIHESKKVPLSSLGHKNLRRWAMRWIDKKLSSPNVFWITKSTSFQSANKRVDGERTSHSRALTPFTGNSLTKLMQFVVNAVSGRGQPGVKPLCRTMKAKSTRYRCGRERQVQVMIVPYVTLTFLTQDCLHAGFCLMSL